MQKCIVKNLKDTKKLAKAFSKTLVGGEVILFNGDLGAGKTTFTQFCFKSLGVKEPVTSPTFTLLREYKTKKLNLYHFDMYRISDYTEVYEIGFNDYLKKENSVVLIEWYEKVLPVLKGEFIKITINKINDNSREFIFEKVTLWNY